MKRGIKYLKDLFDNHKIPFTAKNITLLFRKLQPRLCVQKNVGAFKGCLARGGYNKHN